MADQTADARIWVGKLAPGSEPRHRAFVEWLCSKDGQELFRRRRLSQYEMYQEADRITVVFHAPHTGDPRIMIDFLRSHEAWPEFWEFESGGVYSHSTLPDVAHRRVLWQRHNGGVGAV